MSFARPITTAIGRSVAGRAVWQRAKTRSDFVVSGQIASPFTEAAGDRGHAADAQRHRLQRRHRHRHRCALARLHDARQTIARRRGGRDLRPERNRHRAPTSATSPHRSLPMPMPCERRAGPLYRQRQRRTQLALFHRDVAGQQCLCRLRHAQNPSCSAPPISMSAPTSCCPLSCWR